MVLLYMVCHGSLTWIPSIYPQSMLALIYQHHGSVMGYMMIYDMIWRYAARHCKGRTILSGFRSLRCRTGCGVVLKGDGLSTIKTISDRFKLLWVSRNINTSRKSQLLGTYDFHRNFLLILGQYVLDTFWLFKEANWTITTFNGKSIMLVYYL